MSVPAIHVTDAPAANVLAQLSQNLSAFNDSDAGPADRRVLAALVESEGRLLAGLAGYTAWGWLYVQWLWIATEQRGQGWAGQLLQAAEAEARARNCHGAYIDTFNPQALHVYQKAGYAVFGTLPDFPPGRVRSFLSKSLA
jgi:GNAT superfamily N-acetyltransferase